jgi:hypothetical protein
MSAGLYLQRIGTGFKVVWSELSRPFDFQTAATDERAVMGTPKTGRDPTAVRPWFGRDFRVTGAFLAAP